jgi:polysaccharide deacetylase 2 family uncharacterized protein YibQ
MRALWAELCRTRLIYVIVGCILAVAVDYTLLRPHHDAPPPPHVVAKEITPPPVAEMPAPTQSQDMPSAAEELADLPDDIFDEIGTGDNVAPLPQTAMPPVVMPAPDPLPVPLPALPSVTGRPKIVIVIDDMGVAVAHSKQIMALPGPLTLSFLPYAANLKDQMAAGSAAGHALMLHIPMEPVGPENPGPDALYVAMDTDTVTRTLDSNIDKSDPVRGINNHMGSRASADMNVMRAVMADLAKRDMFFLDSLTSQDSVAAQAAAEAGVPYLKRDVFLDHVDSVDYVQNALRQLEHTARRQGYAIAIGHPHPATIAVLKNWLQTLDKNEFELVPLASLLPETELPAEPLPQGIGFDGNGVPTIEVEQGGESHTGDDAGDHVDQDRQPETNE